MQSALAPGAPPSLATLLEGQDIALFLDFDGTLVELAEGPDAIAPVPDLADRLANLAHRLGGRCAIVSGRGIDDIERHTGPLSLAMAGSHGSDIRGADGAALGSGPAEIPASIEQRLREFAASEGLDYEHKPHGGALHYRRNPHKGPSAHQFAEALAAEHGWAAQGGKCVVELVAGDANKGAAVCALMQTEAFSGARPFFIGDDLTDEAGFRACDGMGGAGILVGEREETRAKYRLNTVSMVHSWLEL
ncbi:trehalose-6-phosphate phosphatase [Erythrobacter sp. NAP1]|uniref:trehalose-phosphatase n=1 Tax=Erythrobacter sp. NAP1 TaxID=237727 RepID=UPI0000686D50|nr:trehalose-phosphatase [Erythrobacter sp. NAP1]EAQ29872.1 trehalose-6-phosphate phosphatase [Erythrobacter sp. NAP1]